jgi:hypothetical protein
LPSDNQAEEADLADGRKRFHGVDGGIYTSLWLRPERASEVERGD